MILAPDGSVVTSDMFGKEVLLSKRDAAIFIAYTKWCVGRNLTPTLFCRQCLGSARTRAAFERAACVIAINFTGDGVDITCPCTRRTTVGA